MKNSGILMGKLARSQDGYQCGTDTAGGFSRDLLHFCVSYKKNFQSFYSDLFKDVCEE